MLKIPGHWNFPNEQYYKTKAPRAIYHNIMRMNKKKNTNLVVKPSFTINTKPPLCNTLYTPQEGPFRRIIKAAKAARERIHIQSRNIYTYTQLREVPMTPLSMLCSLYRLTVIILLSAALSRGLCWFTFAENWRNCSRPTMRPLKESSRMSAEGIWRRWIMYIIDGRWT